MNDLFLRACRGEAVERTPIWIMRQAGRYLPEYRALRKRVDFVTLCKTPELAVEATLQPIDRLEVDAAILFSDIMVVAEPLGFAIDFNPGPVIEPRLDGPADIDRIELAETRERLAYVYDAIRILRRELDGRVPLIGFAAAPMTLAAYLVEGGGSKSFERFKRLVFGEPGAAHRLLEKVAEATEHHVAAQVEAGAQAIQLFDTWAGLLAAEEYGEFGLRYAARVIASLRATELPAIYFAFGACHLLEKIGECGAGVVGVDWRLPLGQASEALGHRFVLQGNLDPAVLLSPVENIERHAARILKEAGGIPGHIFNLGHGVLPSTPVEHLQALVDFVKSDGKPRR
jgi:uroporphyrinogen decarboxylase